MGGGCDFPGVTLEGFEQLIHERIEPCSQLIGRQSWLFRVQLADRSAEQFVAVLFDEVGEPHANIVRTVGASARLAPWCRRGLADMQPDLVLLYERAWRETAHLAIDPPPRFFHDEVRLTAEGSSRLARTVADGLRSRVWADAS